MHLNPMNKLEKSNKGKKVKPKKRQNVSVEVWTDTQKTNHYSPRTDKGRVVKIDPETVFQLAGLGMDQAQIAAYYGLNEEIFKETCSKYSDLEDALLMGKGRLAARASMALAKKVDDGDIIATIFTLKSACGWIEADKRQNVKVNDSVNVQVYLPDNKR